MTYIHNEAHVGGCLKVRLLNVKAGGFSWYIVRPLTRSSVNIWTLASTTPVIGDPLGRQK